ncbi:Coiled-coil domain containing [Perkinsus olseni]|uniref:Coiled-coil domain containing n=1 Tax=Perkinsus olseni TaxID=32597 RepID=A0A7J6NQW0_PEROL|nr:Coiled-coil domain containing [Perkinsus olseni]
MTSQPASDDIFPGLDVDPALPDPANPFLIPPDDEIFLMRDHERRVRQREREKTKRMKVWQKTTASSRMGRVEKPIMSELARANSIRRRIEATRADSEPPRRERENVSDFLSKKRDMFLVQMSLDVKRNEIRKLEEKAKMKGFDKFLQANDALAHKAMKTADNLSKKKQERTVKLKQLKAQLLVIQSEITKTTGTDGGLSQVGDFLGETNPSRMDCTTGGDQATEETPKKEGIDDMAMNLDGCLLFEATAYIQKRRGEIDQSVEEALAEEEQEVDREIEEKSKSKGRRRRGSRRNDLTEEDIIAMKEKEMEIRRRRHRAQHPDEEQIATYYDREVAESSDEDLPMYFKKPKQLLDLFSTLEEQNLFLIQNGQETQQQLEDMEMRLQETHGTLGVKARQLERENWEIAGRIGTKQRDCDKLEARVTSRSDSGGIKGLLKELADAMASMFATCGYDTDRDAEPLVMLSAAEAKLEEWLEILTDAEATGGSLAEVVARMEREKERERRDRVREEKIQAQNEKNEERLKNSLLRSQAPCGKQLMFRSAPSRKEVEEVADMAAEEHAEAIAKLFGSHPPRNIAYVAPGKRNSILAKKGTKKS